LSKLLITALATPYKNGKIDGYGYEKLISYQTQNGADALLVASTTGESTLLTDCEKKLLFMLAKAVAKNLPLIAGVGGYSTSEAVKSALYAAKLGAKALLIAPPPFSKCTPQGYARHIMAIKKASDIPLILYNVPSRCGYELDLNVLSYLYENGITCVKDAGSDLNYTAALAEKFDVLCGSDELLTKQLNVGAKGVISVVSNVAPNLTKNVLKGEDDAYFVKLAKASMTEVSPVAVKYMLYKKGIFENFEMRLPLTEAAEETQKIIDESWNEELIN